MFFLNNIHSHIHSHLSCHSSIHSNLICLNFPCFRNFLVHFIPQVPYDFGFMGHASNSGLRPPFTQKPFGGSNYKGNNNYKTNGGFKGKGYNPGNSYGFS
ncbi:hypothetical protein ACFX15_027782 [Malus domestica]